MDEDDLLELIDEDELCSGRPSWSLVFFLLWLFS